MKPQENAEIKKVLQYLKIARRSDYVTFNMLVASETFTEEVVRKLERISGWNEKDEQIVNMLAEKFFEETKGRTFKEKSDNLKKILSISGGIAVAIAAFGSIALAVRQRQKNKKEKHDNAEK